MGRVYRETTPAMLARVTAALDDRIKLAGGLLLICCWKLRNGAPGRPEMAVDLWWS
jgi:hypothetical protein